MPGSLIKQYREYKNYSQEYVSKKMGISQNAYSKIENNITQLTINHVRQLSKILEIPQTLLLQEELEPYHPTPQPNAAITKTALIFLLHDITHQLKLKKEETSSHVTILASMLHTIQQMVSQMK